MWNNRLFAFLTTLLLTSKIIAGWEVVDGIAWAFEDEGSSVRIGKSSWDLSGKTAVSDSVAGAIMIPSTLGGKPVTKIGSYAFYNCSKLTSIKIPSSVTNISEGAFYNCVSLESISIPVGVTRLGDYAFYGCAKLSDAVIPTNVTGIGRSQFAGCGALVSVSIPPNVVSIGDYAFYGCSSLKAVEIPIAVSSIGYYAFDGCSSLEHVEIPAKVASIGRSAFHGCCRIKSFSVDLGNPSYKSINGLLCSYDGTKLIAGIAGDVVVPTGVLEINDGLFEGNDDLASIRIPATVTKINNDAFVGCGNLTSFCVDSENLAYRSINGLLCSHDGKTLVAGVNGVVTVPDGVNEISWHSFDGRSKLVSVSIPSSVRSIGEYAFSHCVGLKSVSMSCGVEKIGRWAFSGCSGLNVMTIPSSVTKIDDGAFDSCGGMNRFIVEAENPNYKSINGLLCSKDGRELIAGTNGDVVIPDGVVTIGSHAFDRCERLFSLTIPTSVVNIDSYAFYGCRGLASIEIPESVENLGRGAFNECSNLRKVAICSSVINVEASCFVGCTNCIDLVVPSASVYHALSMPDGLKNIEITNEQTIKSSAFEGDSELESVVYRLSPTNIESRAFKGCSGLKSFTIPGSVKDIGNDAFSGCSGLTSLVIPIGVTNIGDRAFLACQGLKAISIPDGVMCIGARAFDGCRGLTMIEMPSSVSTIGSFAFFDCDSLSEIILPSNMRNIDRWAFRGCSGLVGITIPSCVTNIGESAFNCCSNLTSVTIPTSVECIEAEAFYGCRGLTSVVISSGVKEIGDSAFAGCDRVKEITIPPSVSRIGRCAFANCSGLAELTISSGVEEIGFYAFQNCNGLSVVTIPKSVKYIGYGAFDGCSSLDKVRIPVGVVLDVGVIPDGVAVIRYDTVMVMVCGCDTRDVYNGYPKYYSVALEPNLGQYDVKDVACEIPATPSVVGSYQMRLTDKMFCNTNERFEVTFVVDPKNPTSRMTILPRELTITSGSATYNYTGLPNACHEYTVSGDGLVGADTVSLTYTGTQTDVGSSPNTFDYTFVSTNDNVAKNYVVTKREGTLTVVAKGHVAIADGALEAIPAGYFKGCTELTSLSIPESVKTIGANAFAGCTSLVRIDFPTGLEITRAKLNSWGLSDEWIAQYCRIDDYLVAGATLIQYVGDASVKKLTVPAGIVRIDDGAFAALAGLEEIEFSGTEKIIGKGAFSQDTKLTKVILHEGIEQIVDEAFFGCTKMANVIIPSSVKSVGARAFKQCTALTNAQISYGVESIGEACFFSDWRIEQVDIPSTVTNIGAMAFGGDSRIIRAKLRADIRPLSEIFSNYEHIREVGVKICDREIVDGCFRDCKELKDVFWEGNCPRLGNDGRELYANTWHGDKNETLTTYVEEESTGWDGIEGSDQLPQAWPLVGSCRCSITHKDLPTYLCQFDANGGTLGVQDTYQYSERKVKLPPEPVQSGYKFGGWWTQPIGGLRVTENTIFIEGVYTYLWAHWIKGHTIFLDPNGGEVINEYITYVDESVYGVLPSPVRSGYAFDGWLYDGYKIEPDTLMNTKADHILQAQWKAAQYKVIYHPNGGTGSLVTEDRVYGEMDVLRRNAFVRPGYEFLGWSTHESATSAEFKDGEPVTSLTVVDGEIIELWAVWKESEAVDPTNVELALGGDADWFTVHQLVEMQVGEHAVCTPCFWQSGKIADNERSDLTTKVFGAGKIGFWWRADCEKVRTYKWDHLAFFIDNVEVVWTNGVTEWVYQEFEVDGNQEHELIWRYQKDYEGFDGADCGSVCAIVWTPRLETLEDYAGVTNLTLRTEGDAEWFGVKDEVHNQSGSVRSGVIADGQMSSLKSTVEGAGVIRFWWKTDCERVRNYPVDRVLFYVDGVEQAWTNGVSDWVQKHFTITGNGSHDVEWRYVKDEMESSGQDCAWVSEIEWEPLRVSAGVVVSAEITGGKELLVDEMWPSSLDAQFGAGKGQVFAERFGNDLSSALLRKTGKKDLSGKDMYVWQDYVAGTDPTDPDSKFTAKVEMVDGKPVVSWTPNRSDRVYRVLGSSDLKTWREVGSGEEGSFRFFRVSVEMP